MNEFLPPETKLDGEIYYDMMDWFTYLITGPPFMKCAT